MVGVPISVLAWLGQPPRIRLGPALSTIAELVLRQGHMPLAERQFMRADM